MNCENNPEDDPICDDNPISENNPVDNSSHSESMIPNFPKNIPLATHKPKIPPRKPKAKPSQVHESSLKQNTLDGFITHDSPVPKRKLSDD